MPWIAPYRKATKPTGRKWYPACAHRTEIAEYDAQRAEIREKQMDALIDSAELAESRRNRKAFEFSMWRLRDAREKHLASISPTEPKAPKKPRKKRKPNAETPAAKPTNSGADHVAGGPVLSDAGEIPQERAGDIPLCGGRGTKNS